MLGPMTQAEPRRAKIVCTLGPASDTPEIIGQLIESGMNAARLNFSHGTHPDHRRLYRQVRAEASRRGIAVAILADLQGPKIRVGTIPDPGFSLEEGHTLIIHTNAGAVATHSAGASEVSTTYENLANDVNPGDHLLLDDGAIELQATQIRDGSVHTRVIQGGTLTSNKGINLPGVALTVPALTEKDLADLKFAIEMGVDAVALSFVRRAEDIALVRQKMEEIGRSCTLIAKIEKPEAIENLEAILDAADGIMVARGDLGVEMGPELVPMLQKRAIDMANERGKLVITATQMLDSMMRHPRPTRAEASDVANAVLDGSDAVMLSGETAAGQHPVRAVQTMDKIVRSTEQAPRFWREVGSELDLQHTTNAIASAAANASRSLNDTRAIVTYTGSGGIGWHRPTGKRLPTPSTDLRIHSQLADLPIPRAVLGRDTGAVHPVQHARRQHLHRSRPHHH